jgi:hypothetical protein
LSPIVPHLPVLSCDIVVGGIKLEYRTTLINPGRLTLDAPELTLAIFDDQIIALISTIGGKNHVTEL